MLKTILGSLLACIAVSAFPQVLTKAQEGRREVGQCYSACTDRYADKGSAAASAFADWIAYIFSDQYASLTTEEQEAAYNAFETTFCGLYWFSLQDMRACRDGCIDVENAYGFRTGRARARFNRLFNGEIADARQTEFCEDWDLTSTDGPRPEREPLKAPPKDRAEGK